MTSRSNIRSDVCLDDRSVAEVVAGLLARRPGYVPEWQPDDQGPGAATVQITARYIHAVLQRLNQAPDKNKLAFLASLGIELRPATAARVPVVFTLGKDATDACLPAGSRLVAPPPPESSQQIIFETERAAGLAAAKLTDVWSLWPGRDQYIDHSYAVADGEVFTPFARKDLQDTPHVIYIAHETLLALSGQARLFVGFELLQGSDEHLDLLWEYWDGKVWRAFKDMRPLCRESGAEELDGTQGLTRSGRFVLTSDCAESEETVVNSINGYWIRGRLREPLPAESDQVLPQVDNIQLTTELVHPVGPEGVGLQPELSFSNAEKLDTSKAFYPFGQTPLPGHAFYISSEEVFSKPGAQVSVFWIEGVTPAVDLTGKTAFEEPEYAWEFWNGRRWQEVIAAETAPLVTGITSDEGKWFSFQVPEFATKTIVNEEEALWLRVRLVSGGWGFTATVNWNTSGSNTFTYVMHTPAPFIDFRLGYVWQDGPYAPEKVFTYNDFQYQDHTENAQWPGTNFQPFTPVEDTTPALYLGFDKALPVDRTNIFWNIMEQREQFPGPALQWDYWDGHSWRSLVVDDETQQLRVPGILSFIAPSDSQVLARFSVDRHWLRGRLKEDGPPGEPQVQAVYANAVWALQQETITDDPLGASTGQANQVFTFRQIPVLADERIEVRELSGARANVEWRVLAQEVSKGDQRFITELEKMLGEEGSQNEIEKGDLRIKRGRHKKVTEVWVRWYGRDHLYASAPNDRHYVLERARGRVEFGDSERGKVPPAGAQIVARTYLSGGGAAGNVAAGAITQLLAGVGGVEAVTNPHPAEGGADGETLTALMRRGPQTVRHRGRALSPRAYETMAFEASTAVAVARAIPCRDYQGRHAPGWVTLVIIPKSEENRPQPSFGLREKVRTYIEARAAAGLAAMTRIYVTGPDYLAVDVSATLTVDDMSQAGAVEQTAQQAIGGFLHPLTGGPEGIGWSTGRDVFLSDLAAVLERVPGVDYVEELVLLCDKVRQGEQFKVGDGKSVVAGEIRLKVR